MQEFDQIEYKGYLIDKFEHPQLSGRYEIHENKEPFKFLCRTSTLKEAKNKIDESLAETEVDAILSKNGKVNYEDLNLVSKATWDAFRRGFLKGRGF